MITKEQFNNNDFFKARSTKRQFLFLDFLLKNKDKAFTTKELASEVYGNSEKLSVEKAYFVLYRLEKKQLVKRKLPFWMINEKEK